MIRKVNPRLSYKRYTIQILPELSKAIGIERKFIDMTRDDVLFYLDNCRKPENEDPLHKWIGTYNSELVAIFRFFKWLHYSSIDNIARPANNTSFVITMCVKHSVSLQWLHQISYFGSWRSVLIPIPFPSFRSFVYTRIKACIPCSHVHSNLSSAYSLRESLPKCHMVIIKRYAPEWGEILAIAITDCFHQVILIVALLL